MQLILYTWGIVAWFIINFVVFGDFFHFKKKYLFVNNIDSEQFEYFKSIAQQVIWIVKYGGLILVFGVVGLYAKGKQFYRESKEFRVFFLWLVLLIIVLPVFIPSFRGSNRFVIVPLTLLSIFIPMGINLVFKNQYVKMWIYSMAVVYLIMHSVLYIYVVSSKADISNAYEITQFIDNYVSESNKAIMISEGFREYPNSAPLFYSRSVGQTNCGRNCTYTANDLPIESEKDLKLFIELKDVAYFIIIGNYEPFDNQEKICKAYLAKMDFQVITDFGHTVIY